MVKVRAMAAEDLYKASLVHKEAFVRQRLSFEWLECNLNAFPRVLSYVAEVDDAIVGYILWSQKSGFRPEVVLELEQMAVLPEYQGQGMGRALIHDSLPQVKNRLSRQDARLKHVVVTTRVDNEAQRLYKSALGAEVEATIRNLYSADEVFMVARNV